MFPLSSACIVSSARANTPPLKLFDGFVRLTIRRMSLSENHFKDHVLPWKLHSLPRSIGLVSEASRRTLNERERERRISYQMNRRWLTSRWTMPMDYLEYESRLICTKSVFSGVLINIGLTSCIARRDGDLNSPFAR